MTQKSFLIGAVIFGLCASIASQGHTRPVSYPGGWTFMTENNGMENFGLMHYSFTPYTSVGYRYAYDRETQDGFHGVQMNNLLKRWNNPGSQANIYLKSAIGVVDQRQGVTGEGFTGFQADWEDRRFMVMYENRATWSGDDDRTRFFQNAGFGVAPYVADFGSLHTWVMFHVVHRPDHAHPVQFQPMLRFFKGTYLLEAGYNVTIDRPVVNAIIRF